jgi:hypothetical protein
VPRLIHPIRSCRVNSDIIRLHYPPSRALRCRP